MTDTQTEADSGIDGAEICRLLARSGPRLVRNQLLPEDQLLALNLPGLGPIHKPHLEV